MGDSLLYFPWNHLRWLYFEQNAKCKLLFFKLELVVNEREGIGECYFVKKEIHELCRLSNFDVEIDL